MESKDFSELSRSLTKKLTKTEKKKNGIYFTPRETIIKNIDFLTPFMKDKKYVLEPSCGSCEYIITINNKFKDLKITGIEYNKTIYESICKYKNNNIELINDNFLTFDSKKKYDLIIGNPPYFIMKKKDVDKSYFKYFDGRPNIFILFILKSLNLLNKDGVLSFVLPKNFLNCLYYDKTRKYIAKNYKIIDIIECNDKYLETKQETVIVVIQNISQINTNSKFILDISDFTIFGSEKKIKDLEKLSRNTKSLKELNFSVKVGNIVWNQCKKDLTDDKDKTLLIYNSDIKDNKLSIKSYKNKDKKNYINKKGYDEPLIVINRGYGVGSYNFNYCLINENSNKKYLIENHLISIRYNKDLTKDELIKLYKKIILSFNNKKTKQFISTYFDNNAINTTELSQIIPIYNFNEENLNEENLNEEK